jgi:hypothetical protein
MIPLHQDPCFTFRFADDRIIPRFHLEGVEAGRRVEVFKIDPGTGERLACWRPSPLGRAAGWTSRSRSSCGPARRLLPYRNRKNDLSRRR